MGMKRFLSVLLIPVFLAFPSTSYAQFGGGVTTQGTITPGDCASFVNAYVLQDSGSGCGGGGGSPGGTNGQIQYNNGGIFGGFTISGDSTLNTTTGVMINTGINGTPVTTSLATGALTVTSSSANAFAVGQTGVTNPAFNIDSSIATSVTGVNIQSNVAGSGVTLTATSTGTNEALNLVGKGTGPLNLIGGSGQGVINLAPIQGGATRLSLTGTVANWGTLVNFIFNPNTVSSTAATVRYSVLNAADTALTAGAEAPHTYWNIGNQIRTHASNTIIALQRDFRITGTTHAFATAGGIITNAAAFSVDGPASGGTNATLTNSSGIYIPTTALTNVTNGYGLNITAPTGATNNYPAVFMGGNVGIGTAAPAGNLDVYGPSTNVNAVSISGATAGNSPTISAIGSDAAINLSLGAKGTGTINLLSMGVSGTTFQAARFNATSAAAGAGFNGLANAGSNTPEIAANTLPVMEFLPTTTSVDYITAQGSATGTPGVVTLSAGGTDSAITFALTPIGTGKIRLNGLTTGTNADFLCVDASGNILEQASACTISQRDLKENFVEVSGVAAIDDLMALKPTQFNFKDTANGDPNADKTQYGFIADEVASVDPKLAIYENDMKTPKSYRQEAIIALLVKGFQEQQKKLEAITGEKMVVVGHKCFFNLLVCAE
jgi:hypothetical protein